MIQGQNEKFNYYVEPAEEPGKPIVIMLHGSTERGTDLDEVLRYGPLKFILDGVKLPEATYVQPQLPKGEWKEEDVLKLIQELVLLYQSDLNGIHLMGVSLGGLSVRRILANHPFAYQLASAVMMSPGGPKWTDSEINSIAISGVPLWISHASNDDLSNAHYGTTKDAVSRLRGKGTKAELRFTSFGLSGHSTKGAWERFMTPEHFYLWEWIMAQKKTGVVLGDLEGFKIRLIKFINTL